MIEKPHFMPHTLFPVLFVGLQWMMLQPAEARHLRSEPSGEGGKIYRVLPKDRIPAILNPRLVSAEQARLAPNEPVIGVVLDGEARAYSTWLLNRHEIVNDQIGEKKFAVLW